MIPQASIDTFIILFVFLLRIGIPVAITLIVGRWLEKKLQPSEEDKQAPKLELVKKSKIIRLHCWDINRCAADKRAQCAACGHPDLPCWLALQVEGYKVRPECFTCAFYKPTAVAA